MAKIIHTPRTCIAAAVRLLREMFYHKETEFGNEDPIATEMVEVLRKHGFDLDSPKGPAMVPGECSLRSPKRGAKNP